MTYIVGNLISANPSNLRIHSSLAALFMWLKLLLYLRLFAPFAAFLRMIVVIFRDTSVFGVLFMIAIFGFANTFYILAISEDRELMEIITGDNFAKAVVFSYRLALGDF